jgi:hypothetical protein
MLEPGSTQWEVSLVRVLPYLIFVSILIVFFAALRLPRRLGRPQPTLRPRAV